MANCRTASTRPSKVLVAIETQVRPTTYVRKPMLSMGTNAFGPIDGQNRWCEAEFATKSK